jgi:hypothetical protein
MQQDTNGYPPWLSAPGWICKTISCDGVLRLYNFHSVSSTDFWIWSLISQTLTVKKEKLTAHTHTPARWQDYFQPLQQQRQPWHLPDYRHWMPQQHIHLLLPSGDSQKSTEVLILIKLKKIPVSETSTGRTQILELVTTMWFQRK